MHSRGSAIKFLGTKRHHDKWLLDTENYVVKGCFAMTELGHGSNVSGDNVFSGLCNYVRSTDEVFSSSIDKIEGTRNRDNSNL